MRFFSELVEALIVGSYRFDQEVTVQRQAEQRFEDVLVQWRWGLVF
jgi:hypothetical protein